MADNSPTMQKTRLAAVGTRACPKCGQPKGAPCKPMNGGRYNPRYDIHAARLTDG